MSLNIYFRGVDELPPLEIKEDAVAWFHFVKLDDCDYVRRILGCIENSKYLDSRSYVDEKGRKTYVDFLSISAKCALLVHYFSDSIINGAELRHYALRELLINCDCGNLLLPNQKFDFSCSPHDSKIDVICKGKHYTSLHELAEYLTGYSNISLEYGANPVIRIELKPGIYLLPDGFEKEKAHMCWMFESMASVERITSHTFPSALNVGYVFGSKLRDVVYLSRYDMCDADYTSDMLNFAKDGIILLDCNSDSVPDGTKSCKFVMFGNEIIIR